MLLCHATSYAQAARPLFATSTGHVQHTSRPSPAVGHRTMLLTALALHRVCTDSQGTRSSTSSIGTWSRLECTQLATTAARPVHAVGGASDVEEDGDGRTRVSRNISTQGTTSRQGRRHQRCCRVQQRQTNTGSRFGCLPSDCHWTNLAQ